MSLRRSLDVGLLICCCMALAYGTRAFAEPIATNTILARFGQAASDGVGTLFDFHKIVLNDRGQVACYASMFDVPPGRGAAILMGDSTGLEVVVRQGQTVPGNESLLLQVDATFQGNRLLLNNRGDLAFSLHYQYGGGKYFGWPVDNGIFLAPHGDGSRLQRVSQALPSGAAGPGGLYPLALTESGNVLANAGLHEVLQFPGMTYGVSALFQAHETSLREIVRTGQATPTPGTLLGRFFGGRSSLQLYGDDRIALLAEEIDSQSGVAGGSAVFGVDSSGLRRLGSVPIDYPFDVNDLGQIVFAREAIVLADQVGQRPLIGVGDPAPDRGTFSQLDWVSINNRSEVLFRGRSSPMTDLYFPDEGLFLATDDGIRTIARTGDLAPSGIGMFGSIANARLTDWGAVFTAVIDVPQSEADTYGLFAWDGQQIHEIAAVGQPFEGERIEVVSSLLEDFSVNERGQVAYWMRLANRHNLLALWTLPVPEPGTGALDGVGLGLVASFRRRRSRRVYLVRK